MAYLRFYIEQLHCYRYIYTTATLSQTIKYYFSNHLC
jgi:hypothetical protein